MNQEWFEAGDLSRYLSDNDIVLLHNKMKSTVWLIQSCESERRIEGVEDYYITGTGFCIGPHGSILTCDHNLASERTTVTCLGEGNDHTYNVRILRRLKIWDLAILKVVNEEDHPIEFHYVKFATERGEAVFVGEEVHSIGNPDELFRLLMNGRVVYPVEYVNVENITRRPLGNVAQKTLADSHWSDNRTPWDITSDSGGNSYANALDRNLPLFQVSNYLVVEGGSGSPVFDNRGCVIGMLQQFAGKYNFAIHFSILDRFVKDNRLNDGAGKRESGSSKLGTQQKKKKGRK
ncbi:hypothetical protein OROHE_004450 [Orobanche hederae]